MSVTTTATAQENRIVPCCQPAKHRPMSHFFLSDKGGRHDSVDYVNINPRNMVGDQQDTGCCVGQVRFNLNTKGIKQRMSPA